MDRRTGCPYCFRQITRSWLVRSRLWPAGSWSRWARGGRHRTRAARLAVEAFWSLGHQNLGGMSEGPVEAELGSVKVGHRSVIAVISTGQGLNESNRFLW